MDRKFTPEGISDRPRQDIRNGKEIKYWGREKDVRYLEERKLQLLKELMTTKVDTTLNSYTRRNWRNS